MDRAAHRPVAQRWQRGARCGAGTGTPASARSSSCPTVTAAQRSNSLGSARDSRGTVIVVAVNHPGNNALEDYRVEGMSLWWLRAVDLSAVIAAMLVDRTFGNLIDPARIGAAGHSLGGYTVLAVAGGISNPELLQVFCRSPAADVSCRPPPPAAVIAPGDPRASERRSRFPATVQRGRQVLS